MHRNGYTVLIATAFAVWIAGAALLYSQDSNGKDAKKTAVVRGMVRSTEGSPLYGIVVKAVGDGHNYNTAVFTDENGRYEFPPMPQGHYQVSVGVSGLSSVTLTSATATQDFTVRLGMDFLNQTTGVSWLQALPGSDDAKARFGRSCGGCHGVAGVVLKPSRSVLQWATVINRMAYLDDVGNALPPGQPPRLDISPKNVEVLSQYLEKTIRRPVIETSAIEALVRPRGEAARAVFTEWDTSWDLPERERFTSLKNTYTWVDQKGMIWFIWYNPATTANGVGRIDPKTSEMKKWTYPINNALLHDVTGDSEGNVWVNASDADRIVKFEVKTQQFKDWAIKTQYSRRPHSGEFDPFGNYWITLNRDIPGSSGGVGSVLKLDPRTGSMTEYPTLTKHPGNYGLATDHKGNVWFAEYAGGKLGKVDRSGKLTEYDPPAPHHGPRRVTVDAQDRVWISEYNVDMIGMFDPENGKWTEYDMGMPYQSAQPYSIGVDKSQKVWFGVWNGNSLARFDPDTKNFTYYLLPNGSFPRDIWFIYSGTHQEMVYGLGAKSHVGRMYIL